MSSLSAISEAGRSIVGWAGTMNRWTFGLLAVALALDHLLARRVRASWRVALYAPLALRLLLPTSWTFAIREAPRAFTFMTPVPIDLPPPAALASPGHTSLDWPLLSFVAYIAVAAVLTVGILRAHARLRRSLASGRPVAVRRDGIHVPCPVLVHDDAGPMVVGLLAPRIVLPATLLERGNEASLTLVLRHEVSHLARRDPWLLAALELAVVLAWPVIPVWVAAWRARQLMELACDEGALLGADANERRRYGHTLLDIAEGRSSPLALAAELHFGSSLRARIEALAWTRRWPLALQAALVVGLAIGFAACSSVGPAKPDVSGGSATTHASSSGPWTPPPVGLDAVGIVGSDALPKYCAPFVAHVEQERQQHPAKGSDETVALWNLMPVDGLPADQVAFCRSSKVLEAIDLNAWSAEARNGLGQIAKDTVVAYQASAKAGEPRLCPSAGPTPKVAQAPNLKWVHPWPGEFGEDPGWSCLRFSFAAPTYFQYRVDNAGTHFTASAHARRTLGDGRTLDVTMVIRGEAMPREADIQIAPKLEETWRVL